MRKQRFITSDFCVKCGFRTQFLDLFNWCDTCWREFLQKVTPKQANQLRENYEASTMHLQQ